MLRGWIDSFGALATIIFIVVYAAAVVAFLPATPLTLLAGLVFGAVWGTLWAWIGATLGATLAFLVEVRGPRARACLTVHEDNQVTKAAMTTIARW